MFLAFADATASNITADGSAPSPCFTTGTPARSPHMESCSAAAALNVSAAASITLLPSFLSLVAIFPIVVVLPPPFTPITRITSGVSLLSFCLSSLSINLTIIFLSIIFTTSGFVICASLTRPLSSSIILMVVSMPISEVMRISSSSSKSSSSTTALAFITSDSLSESLPKKDFFSRSDIYVSPNPNQIYLQV